MLEVDSVGESLIVPDVECEGILDVQVVAEREEVECMHIRDTDAKR